TVLSTSTKRSGKTEIVVRQPAHPRRAPGGELARALARHIPARRAALTAMLRDASDDIGDLAPATIHDIVKLLAGTDLQTMTRHASDVRALAARHLPHPPSAGLEFETAQFDLDWLFIQGRNFVAADYAHALAAWLCRHIAGAAEPLHEALHSRLGIPRPAPSVPRATAISPTQSNHNGTRTTAPYLGEAAPDLEIEALLVDNAGQVLIGPYMPRLFSMLGLTEAGQFRNAEAAERAVHLLQCVVGGPSDTPEAMLGLNKILCGVPAATAIAREITITEQERDTVEMMLRAIIEHWKKIGNTTPDGLRQSFLRRTGRMHLKEDAWYLNVEPGTFDMLLDSLPWSFSIIKHPWMERAVHVNWR
ncbi:MAG TPA: contractile injection system tape measure protein, partial [Duganella sp.]|uniref:contractile injection system tape measure protein n=1 Tax=Duganella sp. TaxID=1904440 RepID=UPI002ED22F70